MDARKEQLIEWLANIGVRADTVVPASADASFRRYFRATAGKDSYIVMDAPPGQEDTAPFIRVARRFADIGLNVPKILAEDTARGFLLLSDLGDQTYLQALTAESVEGLYADAMEALVVLQAGTGSEPGFLPRYDRQLLLDEMALFPAWLLEKHLGLGLDHDQREALDKVFACLADNALAQPAVWVHRDYHSRNLMVMPGQNPGILDFQDAVTGPVTYDLVSLLRDCYIDWPQEQVETWVRRYQRLALEAGLPLTDDQQEFLRWFDLMGVQRHLKAAGIFARLYHRDGKAGYLGDIPRTIGYIAMLRDRYPELQPLIELIGSLDQSAIVATMS